MTAAKSKGRFYTAWPTAWGPMGAAAGDSGLCHVVLPHYQLDDLLALLAWEHPAAARDEGPFERLIQLSRDYFNRRKTDFAELLCDLPPAGSLRGKVLRACREIPYARTESYRRVAERIGRPDAARAVAAALAKNPVPLVIPCHRVTYSDGRAGGFSAPGGVRLKQRMLATEQEVCGSP